MDIIEEELQNEEHDNKKARPPYLPDLHLKSAIKLEERTLFISFLFDNTVPCPIDIRRSVISLITEMPRLEIKITTLSPNSEVIYHRLLDVTPRRLIGLEKSKTKYGTQKTKFKNNVSITKQLIKPMLDLTMRHFVNYEEFEKVKSNLLSYDPSDFICDLHVYRKSWETLRDRMQIMQVRRDKKFVEIISSAIMYPIVHNDEYLLIHILEESKSYLLSYSQVLMLTDTITSRYLSLLTCEWFAAVGFSYLPTPDYLLEIYSWGDNVLLTLGNKAYDLFKNFEAICTGVMLNRYEPLDISKEFLSNVINDGVPESCREQAKDLVNLLMRETVKPSVLFEVFGCYRHFGHPTVNEEAGCLSMQENTRKILNINSTVLRKVGGAFNLSFIIQFIKRHNRWPKCKYNGPQTAYENIQEIILNKPMVLELHSVNQDMLGWSYVKFGKEIEYDDHPDFTILLSDRSLSPYRSNFINVYNQELIQFQHTNMTESRRVLIEVLRRPEVSCKKIRDMIETREQHPLPLEWFIVGLHSKEREEKIGARLFAMLCLDMRLYFNMTEKNIAEGIFKYMPNQTMTWSEADIMKTLLKITNPCYSNSTGYVDVFVSLDFMKWNQMWRDIVCNMIFGTIDDLQGTPGLLTFTHEFFQKALYYLSSRLNPCEFLKIKKNIKVLYARWEKMYKEGIKTWLGQLGGCEGLRQKGWTAITLAALLLAEIITGIKVISIGQGDNQVAKLAILMIAHMNKHEYLIKYGHLVEKEVKRYLHVLEEIMSGIGMTLKIQECWVSTTHLNYGKELIVNGAFMGSVLKKISRAYQEVSDTIPTIDNRISSIYSSAQSGTLKGFDPIIMYQIATLESLLLIDHETEFGTLTNKRINKLLSTLKIEMTDDIKLFFTCLPKAFGGFQIVPFTEFLIRGHPDPLTSQLVWLKACAGHIDIAENIKHYILSGEGFSKSPSFKMLIQDPLSINWEIAPAQVALFQDLLMKSVKSIAINKDVVNMFNTFNNETLNELIDYLASIEPCSPRVINEFYRLSPEGTIRCLRVVEGQRHARSFWSRSGDGLQKDVVQLYCSIDGGEKIVVI